MKLIFSLFFTALLLTACSTTPKVGKEQNDDSFTFTFLTDIHLQPELRAPEGFQMAIDSVNAIAPDFVITGGDLVMDALNTSHERADSLYNLYMEMTKGFNMPVYNTMGNHDTRIEINQGVCCSGFASKDTPLLRRIRIISLSWGAYT